MIERKCSKCGRVLPRRYQSRWLKGYWNSSLCKKCWYNAHPEKEIEKPLSPDEYRKLDREIEELKRWAITS